MLSIEEKPLVRAAFLLCKKVQVFVSFDVAHYTSKLLAFSQIAQNAPRMGASPYAISIRLYKNLYFCDCA